MGSSVMTKFKNTGRSAHKLPKNILIKKSFLKSGKFFNSNIEGIKSGPSSLAYNISCFKKKQKSKLSNRYGEIKVNGKWTFSKASLKPDASRVTTPGTILGYTRSRKRQKPNRTLVKISNVRTKQEAQFYLGKCVLYFYRVSGKNEEKKKNRTLVGKITKLHGNIGIVQVNFRHNINPTHFGKRCRILLYP